jgi:hypothetical protein
MPDRGIAHDGRVGAARGEGLGGLDAGLDDLCVHQEPLMGEETLLDSKDLGRVVDLLAVGEAKKSCFSASSRLRVRRALLSAASESHRRKDDHGRCGADPAAGGLDDGRWEEAVHCAISFA